MSTLTIDIVEAGGTLPRELVIASAGSGKTFRISSAIITLLARGSAPDEIFASTFTRKAAGEILDRVLVRLAAAALDPEDATELAVQCGLAEAASVAAYDVSFWAGILESAVRCLHRLNVGTLDSFFLRTAKSFAHELGLPTHWSIADESVSDQLRSLALQDVLRNTDAAVLLPLVRDISRNPATRSLHDGLLRRLRALMAVHYTLSDSTADHWEGLAALAEGADLARLESEREQLAAEAATLEAPRNAGNGKPNFIFANALERMAAAVAAGDWQTFAGMTLVQASRKGDAFSRNPVSAEIADLIDRAWLVGRSEVAARMHARSRALGRFAELYAEALECLRMQHGLYEFDDVTRFLGGADPLGTRADLYYRLDAKARHILLDEFQDTAVPQWQALAPVVEELLSGHRNERAAVIVADPKQSIYGWRGGTPGLVKKVRATYALDSAVLAKSWRSSKVVLDFVNDVYAGIGDTAAWEDEACAQIAREWCSAFTSHEPAKVLPGYVELKIGPEDEGRGESRPKLCRFAANEVARLHHEHPDRTIGVLTRTNLTVARMMLNLRDLGVHASEEGGNPLSDAAPVTAILALLRLADNPGNSVARYHVATSPLGQAIGYIDHTGEAATLAQSSRYRRLLLEEGYGRTMASLTAQLESTSDARERRRLSQLVELGFRFDESATLRPSDFVRFVRTQRVEDPVAAQVRVMTVHQAKGLEFDIVVLPELDSPLVRARTPEVLAYREDAGGPVVRAFPYVNKALRPMLAGVAELTRADDDNFRNELRDGLSTMYVALTRARHALHIVVSAKQGKTKSAARVLLRIFEPGREQFNEGEVVLRRGIASWRDELPRMTDAPAPMQSGTPTIALKKSARSRSFARRSPSQLEGSGRVDLGMVLRLTAAAERGSIVHRWLEEVEWLDGGLPSDNRLRELAHATSPAPLPSLDQLIAQFRGWMTAPAVARLLGRSAWEGDATAEREVAFLMREQNVIVEGFIDRLVLVREAGRVVRAAVIDYKTDAVASKREVQQRTAHYSPQLEAYRRAACRMYRLQTDAVQAWLVFLEAGEVVPVSMTRVTEQH